TLGGRLSYGNALNDAGQIVGWAHPSGSGSQNAFLFSNGSMRDIGNLGGTGTASDGARSINEKGYIVGNSHTPANGPVHAFLYDGTTMIDLGTLGGATSTATDINNHDQVVG